MSIILEKIITIEQLLLQSVTRVTQNNNNYYKSRDVIKMLQVSPSTLQNMRISQKIKTGKKLGGTWRYDKQEIDRIYKEGI